MSRRTFITIAIGVLFALLMAVLWWWFFASGGAPAPTKPTNGSTFGTATDRTGDGTGVNGQGNGLGSGRNQGGQNAGSGGIGSAGGIGSNNGSGSSNGSGSNGSAQTNGVSYLAGSSNASGAGVNGGLLIGGSPNSVTWLAGGGITSGAPTTTLGSVGYGYNANGLTSNAPGSNTPGSNGINIGTYNPYGPGGGPYNPIPYKPGPYSTSTGPLGLNSGNGTPFTPADINALNLTNINGNVYVPGTGGGNGSNNGQPNNGLAIGLVAGTAVSCLAFMAPGAGSAPTFPPALYVQNPQRNNEDFMNCLMRTIARAALQQMTNSIVQWINSGFNGSPSFVTNYQQFFASVADQAAGSFIQNYTNFAPFCTPFRNQIRIALAQSYARRNQAPSCSLSTLLGTNTQGLFGGKGTSGWNNLLQFTTVPTNNAYGSYLSAQTGLQSSMANAYGNANRNISPGGFLNMQKVASCPVSGGTSNGSVGQVVSSCPAGCKCDVITPGQTIQDSLSKTLGVSQDYLTQAGISGSFDAIVNALITQLMQKALYSGVSSLSNSTDYNYNNQTFDQQTAQAQGQYLMTQLQNLVNTAQQYGQTKQGAIKDIQATQAQLNALVNCWQAIASSTNDATAIGNASSTRAQIRSYDAQVASFNADITRTNAAIATLQDLQTKTLAVTSTADVTTVQNAFNAAQSNGLLVSDTDLTTAQQDRTTLQATLNAVNQATATGLQQCNAHSQSGN